VPDSTEEAAPVKAYTKNLSGSGVCVISDTNFPKGSNVRIELDLSNDVRFRARCVVLRSQPIEVGREKAMNWEYTLSRSKTETRIIL
jgi:hypothetical protein